MSTDQREKPKQDVAIAHILPPNAYRREDITRLPMDMLFPLLEPILAFGGVSSYFLIAIAAMKKKIVATAFLAASQALALQIWRAKEGSELLRRARQVYAAMARRALPTLEFLNPISPHTGATRPRVLFLIPHGMFCIAGKRYCSEVTVTGHQPSMTFFVDDKLCALSPIMGASARLCGSTRIRPVGDKSVRAAMANTENIAVFPGGFIEATCTSRSCLRINATIYSYWVNRCLEHGYDIEVALIYHGAEIWEHGESFFDWRLSLAKRGVPGIQPTLPSRTPLAVREIFYSPPKMEPGPACLRAAKELSASIVQDIVATYANDAQRVLELTGKTLKRLEVIGAPVVGELPQDTQLRQSSRARL